MFLPPQFAEIIRQALGSQSPGGGLGGPIPFEGWGWQGGAFKSPYSGFPQAQSPFQNPFQGMLQKGPQMYGWGPSPFQGIGGASPDASAWLQNLFSGGGMGTNSGGQGMRGPAPNPFLGLQKFAGPFGNGGGAIMPGFGGGGSMPGFGMGIRQKF